ncbi:hypothetical protein D9M68_967750 [compost metagenome]
MPTIYTIRNAEGTPCEGKNGKGEKIIAAKRVCEFTGESFGVYVLCENYKAGRIVKTWRAMEKYHNLTRDEAITAFNKINKA